MNSSQQSRVEANGEGAKALSPAPSVLIRDFLESETDPLRVRISPPVTVAPATICLSRYVFGFSFSFDLHAAGARKLAAALLDMADQIDPEELTA